MISDSESISQDVTTSQLIQPEINALDCSHSESEKIKELCRNLGLLDSVYSSNSDVYYPVLTPDHDDIDYINFKDIINKSWSIPLDNLSTEDIQLELSFLKRQKTSSPKPNSPRQPDLVPSSTSSGSKTDKAEISTMNDEKKDPTYGLPKKKKPSK